MTKALRVLIGVVLTVSTATAKSATDRKAASSDLADWAFVDVAVVCESGGVVEAAANLLNYRLNKAIKQMEDVVVRADPGQDGRNINLKIRPPFKVSAPAISITGSGASGTACVTLTK